MCLEKNLGEILVRKWKTNVKM